MKQLVCPACGALNRTPGGRDPRSARCGRCHGSILTGKPVSVTALEFDRHRTHSRGLALLLDVWAPWCGPCQSMAPDFAAAASELEPEIRLLKLDADEEPAAAAALNVSSLPSLLLFRDGSVIARISGALSKNRIIAWSRQALLAGAP